MTALVDPFLIINKNVFISLSVFSSAHYFLTKGLQDLLSVVIKVSINLPKQPTNVSNQSMASTNRYRGTRFRQMGRLTHGGEIGVISQQGDGNWREQQRHITGTHL